MKQQDDVDRLVTNLSWWFAALIAPFIIALWMGVAYLGIELWKAWP